MLFPEGTTPHGINDSGVVVGQGSLDSSSFHAFVYANGRMIDIGPPGSFQASAIAINDAGQVLGSYYTGPGNAGPFVYQNGHFTYLGQPPGMSVSPAAINSIGQIAGTIYLNNGSLPPHAAIFNNGVWTDLGAFSGVATHGTGINTSGQVIATAFFPVKSYHPFIPGKHVALVFRNNSLADLNKSIPANSGFTLTDAIAINDAGQILCNAATATTPSYKRAVLLSPKNEGRVRGGSGDMPLPRPNAWLMPARANGRVLDDAVRDLNLKAGLAEVSARSRPPAPPHRPPTRPLSALWDT
jgi:probable HAF family extracellular repeat protein